MFLSRWLCPKSLFVAVFLVLLCLFFLLQKDLFIEKQELNHLQALALLRKPLGHLHLGQSLNRLKKTADDRTFEHLCKSVFEPA